MENLTEVEEVTVEETTYPTPTEPPIPEKPQTPNAEIEELALEKRAYDLIRTLATECLPGDYPYKRIGIGNMTLDIKEDYVYMDALGPEDSYGMKYIYSLYAREKGSELDIREEYIEQGSPTVGYNRENFPVKLSDFNTFHLVAVLKAFKPLFEAHSRKSRISLEEKAEIDWLHRTAQTEFQTYILDGIRKAKNLMPAEKAE